MSSLTITLTDKLLEQLALQAQKLSIPENEIIEKALEIYLDQLNRAEYLQSYKQISNDSDFLKIAEEGMIDYLNQKL